MFNGIAESAMNKTAKYSDVILQYLKQLCESPNPTPNTLMHVVKAISSMLSLSEYETEDTNFVADVQYQLLDIMIQDIQLLASNKKQLTKSLEGFLDIFMNGLDRYSERTQEICALASALLKCDDEDIVSYGIELAVSTIFGELELDDAQQQAICPVISEVMGKLDTIPAEYDQ